MKAGVIVAGLLLAGCGREPEPRADTTQAPPATESASIRAYQSPPRFPLPFGTSVPATMRAEAASSEVGATVKFVDSRNPAAYVHLLVHPSGYALSSAEEDARAVAESYRVPGVGEVEPTERVPWALSQYRIQSRGTTGTSFEGFVALGRHADRLFHVVVQYPAEFADGFVPHASLILDRWRWTDTGQGLQLEE